MNYLLKVSEVVEAAISIEENGRTFYRSFGDSTKEEEVKGVFYFLADEENRHIVAFKNISRDLEKYTPEETYSGEHSKYISDLADKNVFSGKNTGKDLAKKISTPFEAIDLALRFEKDSILFFDEMRRFVSPKDHEIIDKLIEEERQHIVKLKRLEKTLKDKE